MKSFLVALTVLLAGPAVAGVHVVDGDTVKIDGVTIRIVQIDTPETYCSRCENELVLGLKAKERLRALLDAGVATYKARGFDRFGRTLAPHVYAGEVDVGEQLLNEGHALPYVPRPEAKAHRLSVWCPR